VGHGIKNIPQKRANEPQDYPTLVPFPPYIRHARQF